MSDTSHALLAVVGAFTALAVIALLVSNSSNTTGIINTSSQGFSSVLNAAMGNSTSSITGLSTAVQPLSDQYTTADFGGGSVL